MKERPILFSAPMVRAILEGRKSQTRRIVKLREFQRTETRGYDFIFRDKRSLWNDYRLEDLVASKHNPYGKPGDRLWVREAFTQITGNGIRTWYRADGEPLGQDGQPLPTRPGTRRWWPSIHMSRKQSRISLEVTGVRVERLQAISHSDATAEGAKRFDDIPGNGARWSMEQPTHTEQCLGSPQMAFANLYNKVHAGENWNLKPGPSPWDENPWVWVVEFSRVDAMARAA